LLLFKDPAYRRGKKAGEAVPMYAERVPFRVMASFTCMQLAFMLGMLGISWAGQGGIAFPVLLLIMIPIRHSVVPRHISSRHLRDLDRAKDLEALHSADEPQYLEEVQHDPNSFFTDQGFASGSAFGEFAHIKRSSQASTEPGA